jgi:hypothetical protein
LSADDVNLLSLIGIEEWIKMFAILVLKSSNGEWVTCSDEENKPIFLRNIVVNGILQGKKQDADRRLLDLGSLGSIVIEYSSSLLIARKMKQVASAQQ